MQRFEDYNLLGSRLADSTRLPSTVDEAELRRVLAEIDKRSAARAELTPEPVRKAAPARSTRRPVEAGPLERRPAGAQLGSGSRGFAWALRTLRRAPEWELRADIERDPESWIKALANLDRMIAALEAGGC